MIRPVYKTYCYGDEGLQDHGYGCSYRNIQTIISASGEWVPPIRELVAYFFPNYEMLAKTSKQSLWIEPYQIGEYLIKERNWKVNHALHICGSKDIHQILNTDPAVYFQSPNKVYSMDIQDKLLERISDHFSEKHVPIVIDNGTYSYCIADIDKDSNQLMIIDPHKSSTLSNHITVVPFDFLIGQFWMILFPLVN